jgi:hypothetical protein
MNINMKKETALDFLFKSIYGETGHFDAYTTQGTPAYDVYKEAKEMERQEAEENFIEGWYECIEKTKETKFELDHKDVEFFAYAHAVHEYGGEL